MPGKPMVKRHVLTLTPDEITRLEAALDAVENDSGGGFWGEPVADVLALVRDSRDNPDRWSVVPSERFARLFPGRGFRVLSDDELADIRAKMREAKRVRARLSNQVVP